MVRSIKILIVFLFLTSVANAEIITIVNSSTATGSSGQSSELLADYLRLRVFRETIDGSANYIKNLPDFTLSDKDVDSAKLIAMLVARISILSTDVSKEGDKFKVTLKMQVDIDSETVKKYLPTSLENNQFKAFGRKFADGLINLETKLLTSAKLTPELNTDIISTFAIQRSRAYEMNKLSLEEFTEKSTKDDKDQKIIKDKEIILKNIASDMKQYEKEIDKRLAELLHQMAEETKYKLKVLDSIEKKYANQDYSFNSSPDHDIVSAKNEIITTRKKIQLIVKSFFYDTDQLKSSVIQGYDNISKYINGYRYYDADPIKDRWESSYHYEYRLTNYQARRNKEDAFVNDSMKKVLELRYRAEKIIKVNSLLALVKVLEPYQNHLKELQEAQYIGVGVDDVYILNVGSVNRSKKLLPIKVRYLNSDHTLDFNLDGLDESAIKYFVNYSRYFVAYPLFRLSSSGVDAYDIDTINSGFLIVNRGNKIKEPFLVNKKLSYFPEILYSDEFKKTLMEEKININEATSSDNISYDLTTDKATKYATADNLYFTYLPLTKVADVEQIPTTQPKTTETINYDEFINSSDLDNRTKDLSDTVSSTFRMLFNAEVKNKYAGSISITPGTSNGLAKYSNSNYLLKNGVFGVRGDMQFWFINVQPMLRFLQSGRGKDADINRFDINRLDALIYANYQHPLYFTQDVTILPYAGVGAGLSYYYAKLKTGEENIPSTINAGTLLLSAQAGVRATYKNLLVGVGFQINYSNPIIYDRLRNMNNYSFLIEIGYAFFNPNK